MAIDSTFPTKLDSVSDAPEPLRSVLLESLPPGDSVRFLVYSPVFPTGDEKSPATLLAVTESGWFLASETEDGRTKFDQSSFDQILFLELRSILLLGQLRICFAASSSASIKFDAVGDEYYSEAIELLLAGIDPARAATAGENQNEASMFTDWPTKFRNEAKRYRPRGQRLLAAARWPEVTGESEGQIAPAGALLITERELVLISDGKESSANSASEAPSADDPKEALPERKGPQAGEPLEEVTPAEAASDPVIEKLDVVSSNLPGDVYEFSEIVTFIPRARLADFVLHHEEKFCVLAFHVHGTHGSAKLETIFPSDEETAVLKAMEPWSP